MAVAQSPTITNEVKPFHEQRMELLKENLRILDLNSADGSDWLLEQVIGPREP